MQTIKNEKLEVVISPIAAELKSIRDNDGFEYLWQGDPNYWKRQAINLFPYIGRLTEGCYSYNGKIFEMERHGFLPNTEMVVEDINDYSICYLLRDNQKTLAVYPFLFELRIGYTLSENIINVSYEVKNTGNEPMYFGIGGHPGFRVPLEPGLSFEDYYLEFADKCFPTRIGMSETCYPNGIDHLYPLKDDKIILLYHELFDDDAIVLKDMNKKVTLKSDKGKRSVSVMYPDMPYLGFWHTTKSDAPFVCIEPWTSLPSKDGIIEELTTQPDLICLNPNERYTNMWSIEIR